MTVAEPEEEKRLEGLAQLGGMFGGRFTPVFKSTFPDIGETDLHRISTADFADAASINAERFRIEALNPADNVAAGFRGDDQADLNDSTLLVPLLQHGNGFL